MMMVVDLLKDSDMMEGPFPFLLLICLIQLKEPFPLNPIIAKDPRVPILKFPLPPIILCKRNKRIISRQTLHTFVDSNNDILVLPTSIWE